MEHHRTDDTPPISLSRSPCGITAFRVEGCLNAEAVRAHWDGRWLIASSALWDHAMAAIAVEQAFAEAGVGFLRSSSGGSSPEELMLAFVTCCDQIDAAEYELEGRRRVISASRR